MFNTFQLNGSSLNDKELCLTFDDGPGNASLDIAQYLNTFGIHAAFFVVGKYAIEQKNVIQEIRSLGHIIGNHTYEHPDLPYYCSIDGDIQDQINRTDNVIRDNSDQGRYFFRAPYGKWSREVANALNQNLICALQGCGPVHWEIPGIDCHYWRLGKSVEDAVNEYIKSIQIAGKGIVVMHDDIADMDFVKPKNKTFEMLQLLIPKLFDLGYSFVGLDAIPQLQAEQTKPCQVVIRTANRQQLISNKSRLNLRNNSKSLQAMGLTIESKGFGKIALMDENGLYMTVQDHFAKTIVLSEFNSLYSVFDYIHVRDNRFILRSYDGSFLRINKHPDSDVCADVPFMRQAEVFEFVLMGMDENLRSKSIKERVRILKKRWLFVKSKILQV